MTDFLQTVKDRVVIYDGAMGTQILARQHLLTDADYLDNPQRLPHEILGTTLRLEPAGSS